MFVGFIANRLYQQTYIRGLAHIGEGVRLGRHVRIDSPDCVSIGSKVYIGDYTWISSPKLNYYKGKDPETLHPRISIGDGTYIGRFTTIACISKIDIGKKVMISDSCYLGDCYHGYKEKDTAIIEQRLYSPGPIRVGDGTWIGINVSILPNVAIGKHCVIGANSVVRKPVPDYYMAFGNPAQIRKIVFDE
jgi:acetyltransferase-like isoleucine patch superfamily enzyme